MWEITSLDRVELTAFGFVILFASSVFLAVMTIAGMIVLFNHNPLVGLGVLTGLAIIGQIAVWRSFVRTKKIALVKKELGRAL